MTGFLEHLVKNILHLLPYRIAIRIDYHTSSYCRTLGEVCLYYEIVIPLRIVV